MSGIVRVLSCVGLNMLYIYSTYKLEEIEIKKGIFIRSLIPRYTSEKYDNIVVVIPGGPFWRQRGAKIHGGLVKTFCRGLKVYILGLTNCVNFYDMDIIKNTYQCLKFIRHVHPKSKIHLVGSSVGGMVLAWYLAHKLNQADYYYMWCSGIDVEQFYKGVLETFWLKLMITTNKKAFLPGQEHIWDTSKIVPYLKKKCLQKHLERKKPKNLTVIYGTNDRVSDTVEESFKNIPAKLIKVQDGYHCCWHTLVALADAIRANIARD